MKKTVQFTISIVIVFLFFIGGIAKAQGNYFFNTGDFFGWQARTGSYKAINAVPPADVEPKYTNRYSVFVFKNPLIPFAQIQNQITTVRGQCDNTIPDNRYNYRFTLLDTANLSGNDRFDGYTNYHLPKVPPGYRYAAKIGNTCNMSEAEGLVYEFTPVTGFEMLVVKYAMVFPLPHNADNSQEEKEKNPPFEFSLEIKNSNTGEWEITPISTCAYNFINPSKSTLATDSTYHKDGLVVGSDTIIYKTWSTIGLDLTQFLHTSVRLLVTSGDCSPGGHWGYSYVTGMLADSRPYLDYSKICQNPDSDIVSSISMAEGFKYEWTIKDSSTILSTERIFDVPENLMDTNGKRIFTCSISNARTDYPDSMKSYCIGVPKKLDKLVQNYRAQVSMVDTVLENQVMQFTSTSKVFNGAAIVPNKYEWSFGDATPTVTGAGDTISHEYARAGTYRVSLLVHTNHAVTGECAHREYFDVVVPGIYIPQLIQNGKEWSIVHSTDLEEEATEIYWLAEDVTINNKVYKKLLYSTQKDKANPELKGFLREENNRVFARSISTVDGSLSDEGLLYDFNIEVGDTVRVSNCFKNKAEESCLILDSVNLTENEKQFFFKNSNEIWISNIGSLVGLLSMGNTNSGSSKTELLCCKDSIGTILYQNAKYDTDFVETPYKPQLVQNGKEWAVVVKDNYSASENGYTIIYFFQGDTLIENVSYKALYSSRNKDKNNASIEGFLREDKGKVYARKSEWKSGSISTEGLLYDFSLQTADTVTIHNKFYSKLGNHLTVDAVVKDIDGQGLKAYYLTSEESGEPIRADIWYSGIGSHCGIVNVIADLYYGTSKSELLCCKDSIGTLLYQNPKYNSCYYSLGITDLVFAKQIEITPNPVKDYIRLNINNGKAETYTFKLFDSKGNIVLQKVVEGKKSEISAKELLPGIYFYSLNNKEMNVFERGEIVKVK